MTKPGQAISRAKDLANHHKMIMGYGPVNRSFPNIEEDNEVLLESYKETNKQVKAKQNIISAAEWLLDNFYMIEEQSRQIQHELPKNFRGFPVLESGMPRVYAMAEEMISYTNNQLDEDIIVGFLEDYQSVSPLDSSELWIFPFMLKIALIKKIKEIAVHTVKLQREKDVGEKWAIKLLNYVDKESNQLQELIIEHDTTNRMLSPSYIEGLLSNFRESGTKSASLMTWLDGKLGLQGTSADEMIQKSHEKQASYQIAMGNSIISLKFLSSLRWDDIFEKLSHLEKILNQDPAGFYCDMEFDSRDYYRHEIIKLAKRYKISEFLVAQTAIECAEKGMSLTNDDRREGHVGYYLIGEGRRQLKSCFGHSRGSYGILKDHPKAIYLGSIGLAVLLSMGFILYYLNNLGKTHWALLVLAGIVIIVPIITLAVGLLHWIIVKILPPYYLPKLELKEGVPEEYRTMVVVPTLLTSEKRVWELIEQMEVFYLANQEENIHFALIGDFKDSSNEEEDGDQGIIEAGEKAVNELNKRYGGDNKSIFYFFHRHRQFNSVQGSWMGVERKRGALVQFNRLLRGYDDTGFSTQVGDLSILQKIKFVITLDADTNLPRDAAKRLIGTLSHPLNRPVIDSSINRVVKGYGLLQPRIGVAVDSASKSFFSLTFSGQTGVDPYTTAVSDVYQDLFGEGIFTGKGIYEVDVFNDVLKDAIPNNSVLSHDLLEGSYIRAGLVTDIELIDGYPSNYIAYAMRLHRWVRGDWQLIRWLCSHVKNLNGETIKNPLSIISKWKIFDNMRRSLLSPTLFILLFLGFTVLPRRDWFWLGLFSITLTLPLFIDVLESFIKKIKSDNQSLRDILYETKNLAWQIILAFVFLAHQAYLMTDAIVRTLVRVFITKRNMLEWVTAADTERKFKGALEDYWRKMVPAMIMSLGFFVGITLIRGTVLLMPFVISMLWLVSPWIAYKISQPKQKEISKLSQEQIEKLKIIGRRTWRYFDKFIREEDNWLIPDNYQEEPELGIAHRTSPTNIGISIVSILGARDLGYIGTLRALDRLEKIIGSMKRLELWEGHLYNWYDTQSLEPLKPRYVSSVDSGNLACYLILAKQGIGELLSKPLVGVEMISGLEDTIVLDIEALDKSIPSMVNALKGKEEITLTQWSLAMDELDDIGEFSTRSISLFKKEIEEIVPWVKLILRTPKRFLEESGLSDKTIENYHTLIDKIDKDFTIQGIIEDYHEILDSLSEIMLSLRKTNGWKNGNKEIMMWLKDLEIALGESHMAAKRIATRCTGLMDKIGQIVHHMDFIPLYNDKKELFSIGYDVEANKLQDAYYDLLASEARQTSFIAIAKGDVPQKHWFKLARSLTLIGDYRGLLSWGGTMFEYLMPLLIMKNYDNTLWDETYHTVIKAQRQYGDQRHVPWGVSESAFYAFDLQLNYQYKAFGVPKLGLKTGLIKDIVISPYASIMGLAIDPMATVKNIEHLIAEGMAGSFGLYECIDYTPERVPRKKKSMIVKSYMAHHQGMIFLAINNYLNHNIMQERFHAIPMVKATELLLQERMPKKEIVIKDYQMDTEVFDIEQEKKSYQEVHPRRVLDTAHTSTPQVCILSNSSYSTMLTQSGGGFSQYQDLAINRWREDVTKDNWGMFFYVNNLNSNNFWSSTYQPCLNSGDNYEVAFEPDKATYTRRDGNIETKTEIVVSPEDSVEIRRLSISNHSQHNRVMEVTSYFEPILAAMEDDAAHPAFVNLFVETEYIP
ncbi:MAG TPA: glucoamylase family protein, partial [Clostridia bacterium]|nr:glucoamylase family protein [Clostridia bacterium]